jgi:hypothetical protein
MVAKKTWWIEWKGNDINYLWIWMFLDDNYLYLDLLWNQPLDTHNIGWSPFLNNGLEPWGSFCSVVISPNLFKKRITPLEFHVSPKKVSDIMVFLLICAIFFFLGVINMQARWYRQGKLTENNFTPFQVLSLSLLVLMICLSISSSLVRIYIGATLFFLCIFIGFPATRWFYRKFLQHKWETYFMLRWLFKCGGHGFAGD